MTLADPYPASLADLDELPASAESVTETDRLIRAINRLAQAIEHSGVVGQNVAPRAVAAPLAALPPVQTVAATPPCPFHGVEKVRTSTNGKGGFFCAAKALPGQPSNAKGYCTWHS